MSKLIYIVDTIFLQTIFLSITIYSMCILYRFYIKKTRNYNICVRNVTLISFYSINIMQIISLNANICSFGTINVSLKC